MKSVRLLLVFYWILLVCLPVQAEVVPFETIEQQRQTIPFQQSIAMHGEPALQDDWSHLPYANPNAPQGGVIRLSSIGTFDSLNHFISKGTPATQLELLYDTLMEPSLDEPFSVYGLLAESVQIAADKSWVIFKINQQARFHDGHPVSAEDVVFTFNTLVEKGEPLFQLQFMDVADVTALNAQEVLFRFKQNTNKELPLILGGLPILPEHYWSERDFEKPSLENPLASGPYTVKSFKTGKNIVYVKVDDYWAENHPLKKGRNNFNVWRVEYFAESNIALEAFKSGEYTFRPENNSKFWATSYNGQAFAEKKILTAEVPVQKPVGMQGFVYNMRKPIFQDELLREAIAYGFNFEWSNENLFYGQYKRTRSYFENTELAATGLPSEAELALLNPWKENIPERVFTQSYSPPATQGKHGIRKNLIIAKNMLEKAGYTLKDNLLHAPDGTPVTFEILMVDTGFERIVLPFIQNLKILGIQAEPRRVDVNQYIQRIRGFQFDMIVTTFPQSLSPGNEQRNYWHSKAAEQPSSRNLSGIQNPAVDAMIDHIIKAKTREELITACRALDRILQWSFLVIPNWHVNYERLAYWPPITMPDKHPKYTIDLSSWWYAQ